MNFIRKYFVTGIPLILEVSVIEAPNSYCCLHYVLRLVELHSMYCDSIIIILNKIKVDGCSYGK